MLVDFTADWCINCHWNELVALNTKATQELVKEHDVVTLKADFTEQSAEIRRWLLKVQAGRRSADGHLPRGPRQ